MEEKQLNFRTDLAIESKEMFLETEGQAEIDGIEEINRVERNNEVTRVIVNDTAAEKIGKDPGTYITIEASSIKDGDIDEQKVTADIFSEEFQWLLKQTNISNEAQALIVGLGNEQVTPDALGPLVSREVLVTNHMFKSEETFDIDGYRPVSAVTPGVMGLTGLETSEIIKGIVDRTKPDFVIAVDALAARSVERLNKTIQLSNTGIAPGSGVGNARQALNEETLHVPVLAIGVPTVVDATTIVSDSLNDLLKHLGYEWKHKDRPNQALLPGGYRFGQKVLKESDLPSLEQREVILGAVGRLSSEETRQVLQEALHPIGHNLIVTPKEVDYYLDHMSRVIATGINVALHEATHIDDVSF